MRLLRLVRALVGVTVLLAGGAVADAQDTPQILESWLETEVLGRGFDPAKSFEVGDIDSVNTFNGNLVVTIPIGPSYTGKGGFSYSFGLVYNLNDWDYVTALEPEVPPAPLPLPDCGQYETAAYPMLDANAGIGWKLSLGEFYSPNPFPGDIDYKNPNKDGRYMFVAPDGSRHFFNRKLHPKSSPDTAWYTGDGSFLRLTFDGQGRAYVSTPEGRVYRFYVIDPTAWEDAGRWQLDRIWSPFAVDSTGQQHGGWVRISVREGAGQEIWDIEDSSERFHQLIFSRDANAEHYERVLQRALLAGPDGLVGGEPALEYRFHTDLRNFPHPTGHTAQWGFGPMQEDVPTLTGVTQPDGSGYEFEYADSARLSRVTLPTLGEISWEHGTYNFPPEQPDPQTGCPAIKPGSTAPCHHKVSYTSSVVGVVARSFHDPFTGETETWRYFPQNYIDPVPGCYPEREQRRIVFDPSADATVYYYSVYVYGGDDGSAVPGEPWRVSDYGLPFSRSEAQQFGGQGPDLDTGALFLSSERYDCPEGFDPTDVDVPWNSGPKYKPDEIPGERCLKVQARYLRYDGDSASACSPWPECEMVNERVRSERTVTYETKKDMVTLTGRVAYRQTDREDWDGLGHWRRTTVRGSYRGGDKLTTTDKWPARIEEVLYNPGTGTVTGTTAPAAAGVPFTSQPWLLNRYTERWVAQDVDYERNASPEPRRGTAAEKIGSRYCFSSDSGALLGMRQIEQVVGGTTASGLPGAVFVEGGTDVIARFTYDDDGNLVREQVWGGDRSPLAGGGELCGAPPSGAAEYRRDSEYDPRGFLTRRQAVEDGSNPKRVLLTPVDHRSINDLGQVLETVDPSGLTMEAEYDGLGRLIQVVPWYASSPDERLPTHYAYQPAQPADPVPGGAPAKPAKLAMRVCAPEEESVCDPAATGMSAIEDTIEQTIYRYDGFGRPWRAFSAIPDDQGHPDPGSQTGRWAAQHTKYSPGRGRLLEESTLFLGHPGALNAQSPGHTRIRYDVYGKQWRVIAPDGQVTRFLNFGDVATTRNQDVRTDLSTPNSQVVTTRFSQDPFGNLVEVCESSPCVLTKYRYDAGGRLALVSRSGQKGRWFLYDGRGFLEREGHPELALPLYHGGYDTLGSSADVWLGPPGGADRHLRSEYDALGRPVRTVDAQAGRPLVELFYAASNLSPDNRSHGRLVQAKRHNWLPDPAGVGPDRDVIVTSTSVYGGVGGQVSEFQVRTNLGTAYRTGFDYDELGRPARTVFPGCPTPGCAEAPARWVEAVYQRGAMVDVAAVVGQGQATRSFARLAYHPNGTISRIEHANGVEWLQQVDSLGRARPLSIETSGATGSAAGHSGDFHSGYYAYDPAGNVIQVGAADQYAYDAFGRLSEATMDYPAAGGTVHADLGYSYDNHGNLLEISRQLQLPGGGSTAELVQLQVDPATNRIDAPGYEYDRAGNLLRFGPVSNIVYDPLDKPVQLRATNVLSSYLYDAGGERVATIDHLAGGAQKFEWRQRGLGNQVLRSWTFDPAGGWSWDRDYVRRGSALLASILDDGAGGERILHHHPDHLGSTRLVTGDGGRVEAYHEYFPFGWEATDPYQDDETLRFTGHERDANKVDPTPSVIDRTDDLDYMHARYYSPWLGRFLNVDKYDVAALQFGGEADQQQYREYLMSPQSWNRFAYGWGNPMKFVDRNGESVSLTLGAGASLESAGIAAALESAAAAATAAAPLALAAGAGVAIGYGVNQFPGVSEFLTIDLVSSSIASVLLTDSTLLVQDAINKNVVDVLGEISNYPPPPDPGDKDKILEKLQEKLEKAKKEIQNLPKRARKDFFRLIERTEKALIIWGGIEQGRPCEPDENGCQK